MFAGRVAVVTGGEMAIGVACADILALRSACVVIGYAHSSSVLESYLARTEHSSRVIAVKLDTENSHEVDALFSVAEEKFGMATLLVNAVFAQHHRPTLARMSANGFQTVADAELYGTVLVSSRFVGRLRTASRGGRIVNVFPARNDAQFSNGVFHSHKELVGITEQLALQLAPIGIAVNGVAPGIIDERRRVSHTDTPWGRAGTPDEVAWAASMLLSPASDYITGTIVHIDGALSLAAIENA